MIRYITGRGGSGVGGLSEYLATLDDDYTVLPINSDFLAQDSQGQISYMGHEAIARVVHVSLPTYKAHRGHLLGF